MKTFQAEHPAATHFDRNAARYARFALQRPEFHERFALLRHWIDQTPHAAPDALDLGCGPGDLATHLARSGYSATAVDGSREMLSIAADRVAASGVSVELLQSNLPFESPPAEWHGRFGVIVMSSVVEYLTDERRMFEQCRTMLAPGGSLLVSFPNAASIYWRAHAVVSRTRLLAGSDSRHQHDRQTIGSARALGESVGLQFVRAQLFALPLQRHLGFLGARRPEWLATLFLCEFRAPVWRRRASAIRESQGGTDS